MRPARQLVGPALMAAVLLAVTVTLGMWQVRRLAWKDGLLASIDQAERMPPVPLGGGVPPPFARVLATGTWRPGATALYGSDVRDEPAGPVIGAQLVVVLDRAGGLGPLLVDLGWVPTEGRPVAGPSGAVAVSGYARPADRAGLLSAPDDPGRRRFYTLNPAVIGAALGARAVAPFTLVAVGAAPSNRGVPVPATALPRPPNNHLQYAITWFALGGVVVAMFGVWAFGRE